MRMILPFKYQHTKVRDLEATIEKMNEAVTRLEKFQNDSNLAPSAIKTKCMLLSTTQMSHTHELRSTLISITGQGVTLERVEVTKLLGVMLDEHMSWSDHIKYLTNASVD